MDFLDRGVHSIPGVVVYSTGGRRNRVIIVTVELVLRVAAHLWLQGLLHAKLLALPRRQAAVNRLLDAGWPRFWRLAFHELGLESPVADNGLRCFLAKGQAALPFDLLPDLLCRALPRDALSRLSVAIDVTRLLPAVVRVHLLSLLL